MITDNKYIIGNNDYLITPLLENDQVYSISKLLITSLVTFVNENNKGAKTRRLNILSCYSDRDVSFYQQFFLDLFKAFEENSRFEAPLTHVRILFDKIDLSLDDYKRLKLFLRSKDFAGCSFSIRTSSGGSLLHAKSILLEIGSKGNNGLLFCTSANFTRNGFTGKNREFIFQSNSKKSVIASHGEFNYLWHLGSKVPSFTEDLNPTEPVSLYLLKGYFLIDCKDNKLPLNKKIEIKFKDSTNSNVIQPFLEILLLKESSNTKSVNFELILLEAFFGKELREAITKLSIRHDFGVICSKYLDTYWIMPDTYKSLCLKKNNPFEKELKFYSDVVNALKLALQDETNTFLKFDGIVTEELFESLNTQYSREEFITSIIESVRSVINSFTEISIWELFGLMPIPSHLANHRGEVDPETFKALSQGYLLEFRKEFENLSSVHGFVNTSESEALNSKLFDRLNQKRKESIENLEKLSGQLILDVNSLL